MCVPYYICNGLNDRSIDQLIEWCVQVVRTYACCQKLASSSQIMHEQYWGSSITVQAVTYEHISLITLGWSERSVTSGRPYNLWIVSDPAYTRSAKVPVDDCKHHDHIIDLRSLFSASEMYACNSIHWSDFKLVPFSASLLRAFYMLGLLGLLITILISVN